MNFAKSLRTSNFQTSVALKNKIFPRISFCRFLGFHYKWNRQFPLEFPLETLERVNRVIFLNYSELLLLNIPADKNIFKETEKECFRKAVQLSL